MNSAILRRCTAIVIFFVLMTRKSVRLKFGVHPDGVYLALRRRGRLQRTRTSALLLTAVKGIPTATGCHSNDSRTKTDRYRLGF